MSGLKEEIITLLKRQPNLTDREITNIIRGTANDQQAINQACRQLERLGKLVRDRRSDGLIGNRVSGGSIQVSSLVTAFDDQPIHLTNVETVSLSEDATKQLLLAWLEKEGWSTEIAWGKVRGIDILATNLEERWIIEVKGCGSRQAMRVNYFLCVLGELLQRMSDSAARYSIAFPDIPQFRGLWKRLPELVKVRLNVTALFVEASGTVHLER